MKAGSARFASESDTDDRSSFMASILNIAESSRVPLTISGSIAWSS